jgi:hypothetical protein
MKNKTALIHKKQEGAALIITLSFLTIITILTLGFVVSMRTERMAAGAMAQNEQAKLLGESALAHAISLLRNNIPDPGDPTVQTPSGAAKNWYSNPGRLTIIDGNTTRTVPLYSGLANTMDDDVAVNLNEKLPSDGSFPITGKNDPMWVSWVNVMQDATQDPSANNRIVGRYAFWIDDESTKINVNVARGKPASMANDLKLPADWEELSQRDLLPHIGNKFTVKNAETGKDEEYGVTHPAAVNLDVANLSASKISEIEGAVGSSNRKFFTNLEQVRPFYGSDQDFEAEKFNLTVHGRSPEFNVFGKSRIFLSKWASGIGEVPGMSQMQGPAYQHSYHPEQPMTFYAHTMGIHNENDLGDFKGRVRTIHRPVIDSLARYLKRNDWPGLGNDTFKWNAQNAILNPPNLSDRECDQIAVNINTMVSQALRGRPNDQLNNVDGGDIMKDLVLLSGSNGDVANSGTSSSSRGVWRGTHTGRGFIGLQAFPMLNEVGVELEPIIMSDETSNTWGLRCRIITEHYLPPGFLHTVDPDFGKIWHCSASSGSGNDRLDFTAPYVEFEVVPSSGTAVKNIARNSNQEGKAGNGKGHGSPADWDARRFLKQDTSIKLDDVKTRSSTKILGKSSSINFIADVEDDSKLGTEKVNDRSSFPRSGAYTVKVKLIVGFKSTNGHFFYQRAPFEVPIEQAAGTQVDGTVTTIPTDLQPSSGDSSEVVFDFEFQIANGDIQSIMNGTMSFPRQSYELEDPRTYYYKSAWTHQVGGGTLGQKNTSQLPGPQRAPIDIASNLSKFAMWNVLGTDNSGAVGMLSFTPTGMQRGKQWETLRFHQHDRLDSLPDWLVLDLVAPSFEAPISARNSTAGKVNLNSRIYPDNSSVFRPPARTKPIEALFKNMPNGAEAAQSVNSWQSSTQGFDYIGRVSEVSEVADSSHGELDFDKEVMLRNLAGMMTTQSNVFSVWGVAQTVKKRSTNVDDGVFEPGDLVTGEKRFHAIVERYVWPGIDGVPGYAEIDQSGKYNGLASGGNSGNDTPFVPGMPPTLGLGAAKKIFPELNSVPLGEFDRVKTSDPTYVWPKIDGPHSPPFGQGGINVVSSASHGTVEYKQTTAEEAKNPLAAFMKYKIIQFTYLD